MVQKVSLVQESAYFSIALQISSVVLLAFRSVMAKFLERLASRRVTLFTAFWATLLFVQERSTMGPWALVLNSSSNLSRSSSCTWVKVTCSEHISKALKTHFLIQLLTASDGLLHEHTVFCQTVLVISHWETSVFTELFSLVWSGLCSVGKKRCHVFSRTNQH